MKEGNAMTTVISMKDVALTRNQKQILSSINWQVKDGQHWGILGLNGSGKTSLLNIINGYHFPTSGEVTVLSGLFGKTNLPELRKKIGFVSSSLDRFSNMVNNEVALRVVISGKFASFGIYEKFSQTDIDEALAILQTVGLAHLKNQPFNLLSQGEQRRVLIARALMSKPKILILDEPCSGLDILAREQLLDMLDRVAKSGCHILYVTHHIEELTDIISHVLLLKDGQIVATGEKHTVLNDTELSETFKVPVKITWQTGRPSLSIAQKTDEMAKIRGGK